MAAVPMSLMLVTAAMMKASASLLPQENGSGEP
jgi:hypothetical protein